MVARSGVGFGIGARTAIRVIDHFSGGGTAGLVSGRTSAAFDPNRGAAQPGWAATTASLCLMPTSLRW